jgi:hypothetical protein
MQSLLNDSDAKSRVATVSAARYAELRLSLPIVEAEAPCFQ